MVKKIVGGLLILSGIGLLVGALSGKETSENLFYSLLFIGGGILIISLKNKNEKKNFKTVQTNSLESTLKDLKEKKLLTDEEFLSKIEKLKLQEKKERLQKLAEERIKILMHNLEQLSKNGLLNDQELIDKKSMLVKESYDYFKSFPFLNPDFPLKTEIIKKATLTPLQQEHINEVLPNFKTGQVIILNKLTDKLERISLEKFYSIENTEIRNHYACVDIFD